MTFKELLDVTSGSTRIRIYIKINNENFESAHGADYFKKNCEFLHEGKITNIFPCEGILHVFLRKDGIWETEQ